jgi:hypothetical protein
MVMDGEESKVRIYREAVVNHSASFLISVVTFEDLTATLMKSNIFWDVKPLFHWKSTNVSEEHLSSIFRVH